MSSSAKGMQKYRQTGEEGVCVYMCVRTGVKRRKEKIHVCSLHECVALG